MSYRNAAQKTPSTPLNQDAKKEHFVQLPLRIVTDPRLTAQELRILAVIVSYDWESKGNGCTASQQTIAEKSHTSASTVKRALKKFEQPCGYIFPPEAQYFNGARVGTVIRVTDEARPGAEHLVVVPETGMRQEPFQGGSSGAPPSVPAGRTPSVQGPDLGGSRRTSKTDSPKLDVVEKEQQRALRGFSKRVRPQVAREPLTADDSERLRQLDAWGCSDSVDWLGMLLGILANRERQLGRVPNPTQLRAAYDGAVASRLFRNPERASKITTKPGLLLAGIERGFLLAHPRGVPRTIEELPPGARSALEHLARRAQAGEQLSDQTLSSYGIDRREFQRLVISLTSPNDDGVTGDSAADALDCVGADEPQSQGGSPGDPPPVDDLWNAILAKLEGQLHGPEFHMFAKMATAVSFEKDTLTLEFTNGWVRQGFSDRVLDRANAELKKLFGEAYIATVVRSEK